ncbi:hypothetical protein [Streptomyces sp. ISL-11]|uniref:hypothetical protein n=1 Tax=Streptomyces sp. ISL-11 TaxID=2819174 RepID=UPI001BEBB3DB|nr:hypothetical protein [Streptomyces sp. ISL-11]MBT2384648.1 hypothetical protein [Streptomyces sp. ISL-11]
MSDEQQLKPGVVNTPQDDHAGGATLAANKAPKTPKLVPPDDHAGGEPVGVLMDDHAGSEKPF